MGRDTIQLKDDVSTISKEYLLEFTLEYSIPESLHPEYGGHGRGDRILRDTPALEKSSMDFDNEDPPQIITKRGGTKNQVQDGLSHEIPPVEDETTTKVILEPGLEKKVPAMGPLVNKRRRKRGNDEAEAKAQPKVLRKDHAVVRLAQSALKGKSLAPIGLDVGSTFSTPATQDASTAAKSVSDPDPLSYVKPQPHLERDIAQCSHTNKTHLPHNVNADLPRKRPPRSHRKCCYHEGARPVLRGEFGVKEIDLLSIHGWVAMRYLSAGVGRDQQLPPGHPRRVPRHGKSHSTAGQLAMGSQLRLRFEQKVRLLKKATSNIARRDQRIQAKEEEIKNLDQEIKSLRAVEAEVSNLQAQVTDEEKIKAAFEEFKKYEDDRVEQRCVEMDACLDKLSVDFDEELYPHMLTPIVNRLVKGMSKGLKHDIEHGKVGRELATIKAYDPKADSKYVKSLQDLKDLKYPLVDQLKRLKDAPMELIMASLHSESDSGEDAP
nr:hypothetical protein [Tanacetum cinerariifolium]